MIGDRIVRLIAVVLLLHGTTLAFCPQRPISVEHQTPQNPVGFLKATRTTNNNNNNSNNSGLNRADGLLQSSMFTSSTEKIKTKKVPLRRWNLNRKGSPFGFDLNAEVWNGRVAQISFVWVFVQELIQGKGILQSISDQDTAGVCAVGIFALSMICLIFRFIVEPPGGIEVEKIRSSVQNDDILQDPSLMPLNKLFDPKFDPTKERKWNYNDGRSPFGLKKNAEIWNGRLAQISFVWLFLQELIQGRGSLSSIDDGNPLSLFFLMAFALTLTGFVGVLTLESKNDDFVERVVRQEQLESNARILQDTTQLNFSYTFAKAQENRWDPRNSMSQTTTSNSNRHTDEPSKEMSTAVTRQYTGQDNQQPLSTSWEQSFADSLRAMTSEKKQPAHPVMLSSSSYLDSAGRTSTTSVATHASMPTVNENIQTSRVTSASRIKVGALVKEQSPHPDGIFRFDKVGRGPTFPVSKAAAYPVEAFTFNKELKTIVKGQSHDFRVSDPLENAVIDSKLSSTGDQENLAVAYTKSESGSDSSVLPKKKREKKVYLSNFPVQGYRFSDSTVSLVRQSQRPSYAFLRGMRGLFTTEQISTTDRVQDPNSLPKVGNTVVSYLDGQRYGSPDTTADVPSAYHYNSIPSDSSSSVLYTVAPFSSTGSYLESLGSNALLTEQ